MTTKDENAGEVRGSAHHIKVHPADDPRVPFLSRLLLGFVSPLLARGGAITTADLWPLRACDAAAPLTDALRAAWDTECRRSAASGAVGTAPPPPPPSFARAWARAFLPGFAHVACYAWLKAMLALLQSRCVLQLLGVVADPDRSVGEGLGWAAAIGATGLLAALADAWYWRETWFFGHRWQVAAQGLLFDKALRLRTDALAAVSTGHAVSLATNDCERFLQVVHHLPHLLLTPLDGAAYTAALYFDLGPACFAGLGLMVLISAAQFCSYASVFGRLRRERAKTTDARLTLTAQALSGIRVIKANAWEPPFLSAAREVRASEVRQLQKHYGVRGAFEGMIHSKYLLLTGATVLAIWASGQALTPEKVYSATALFYLLEMDRMWRFVENAENIADFLVSCRRFTAFLLLPEAVGVVSAVEVGAGVADAATRAADKATAAAESDRAPVLGEEPSAVAAEEVLVGGAGATAAQPLCEPQHLAVDVEDLVATVGLEAGEGLLPTEEGADEGSGGGGGGGGGPREVLRLSLRVRAGTLCAVVGSTGAGKSMLLMALLGELPVRAGRVRLGGTPAAVTRVSYAPQAPFVISGTVRDNVCFGEPCDESRLARVLACCQLSGEVGCDTVVGERGVTLSGGQRARLGLARAVYRRASLYLLDDPLSALDAAVGRRVFAECVRGMLLREAGATVLLVTHQLRFVRAADSTVVLGAGGRVVAEGPYPALAAQIAAGAAGVGAALGDLLGEWRREEEEAEAEEGDAKAAPAAVAPDSLSAAALPLPSLPAAPFPAMVAVVVAGAAAEHGPAPSPPAMEPDDAGAQRAFREDGGEGAVSMGVFADYARFWASAEGGWLDAAHIAVVLVAAAVSFPAVGGFLGAWASLGLAAQQQAQPAALYAALLLAAVALAVWRPVAFARRTVVAGKALHDLVFRAVLTAPTAFFDARPAGSVLARFAKDVQVLDEKLPLVACDVVLQVGRAAGVLVLLCTSNPLVLVALPFLAVAFARIRAHFVRASRAIKRLESASRPPVLSIFAESLGGLAVIRAFGGRERVAADFRVALDANSRPWTAFYFSTRWLALRLDLLCVLLLTLAAAAAVAARGMGVAPGEAAIGLSFVTMLLGELDWMVRQSVELENAMLSVERLLLYTKIETEDVETEAETESGAGAGAGAGEGAGASAGTGAAFPGADWPRTGAIELRDVWMRYRRDGESVAAPAAERGAGGPRFALRGVSLVVPAGSRLGIVGRTGAGKSSLLAALLRLSEPERGAAGDCGVLLDGVDVARVPLTRLRRATSVVAQEPVLYEGSVRSNLDPFSRCSDAECRAALEACALGGLALATPVAESGHSLSVGQRQLLCLARAVLRRSRVVYVDEATANVDPDTDALIQVALRSAFRDSTIVCVAHRLSTLMDYDSIAVLGDGRVVEVGTPQELAAREGGAFAALLREAEAKEGPGRR